jgi:hypothetical protein
LTSRCRGTKRDGEPCSLSANGPDGYCWAHSPGNAEQRRRMASKAGKAKQGRPQAELGEIKRRLSDLADDVLSDDEEKRVDKGVAAVASQVLNVYLRAVSVELKAREQFELTERLEALEEALAQRGGRYGA